MSRTPYKQLGRASITKARSSRFSGSYSTSSSVSNLSKSPSPTKKKMSFKLVSAASRCLAEVEKTIPSFANVQELITIYIVEMNGATTEFKVYKDFLVYSSEFFNAAFNGNFAEANSRSMTLHDTEAKTFGLLVSYIYVGELDNAGIITADDLLRLWILADRVLIPKLQNHVLRIIETLAEFKPSVDLLHHIYHRDHQYSLLRDFISEFFAMRQCAVLADPEDLPKDMLAEIFVVARELLIKKGGKFTHRRLCKFLVAEEASSEL